MPILTPPVRFYIVQKIISANLHTADAECTAYTTNLMEALERTKEENPNEDALLDELAASAYCEQFALQTFAKADRDMNANASTKNTADTLLAASTFLEMLAIWKKDTEPEIKSKQTFAKYHAVRILKAIQAGEDPNLTNPVHEPPPDAALDPNDPEVQNINQSAGPPPTQNPYQPYVETAPNTSGQPSPTFSAPQMSPPPPHFPSAPSGYRDVSPISQPATSRNGSVASVGGGYFPKVNVPTFTAGATAPSLPTASSMQDEPMTTPGTSTLPTESQMPQAPQAPDPHNFYQNSASPSTVQSFPPFSSPNQPQPSQPPPFQPPPQQQFNYAQQPSQPPSQQYTQPPHTSHQGPLRVDEDAQAEATKHARWAISALNFEDVNTAVTQLRLALRSLGAN
jgi:vacuolar protein sorting-associated protein VTA1